MSRKYFGSVKPLTVPDDTWYQNNTLKVLKQRQPSRAYLTLGSFILFKESSEKQLQHEEQAKFADKGIRPRQVCQGMPRALFVDEADVKRSRKLHEYFVSIFESQKPI